ncbi:helical backbone metal receptor [Terrabacter sp. Soil810]|uniref:helical backbone metal receptor n=1 Tax=Terrabacter sp. Soil810 TaxID=1736418 RepID=UPI00070A9C82|nr:helical backbone metal receptor [Terrabacter sp. Soil810]KRF40300.1 ABC transporter substrate-binding protein [Terrabacter sp. Soil810]
MPVTLADDLAYAVSLPTPPRRVVSLVPSITEALATTCPERLVGATDWCTHPEGLAVQRVRGTKNPDLRAVEALEPDLVVANKEENRELDVRRLRDAGVPVWVTDIETVPAALDSLGRLFRDVLDVGTPDWLVAAADEWGGPVPETVVDVAVAIWRDPWMAVGRDTFTGDLVSRLGWRNVLAGSDDRYPHVDLDELDREGVVVLLPDEPYVFTPDDGPEAFDRARTALVSGRLLTWYGPSLVGARASLTAAVER